MTTTALRWHTLSSHPGARIRVSAAALLSHKACAALIEACTPALEGTARSEEYEHLVDYRSVPLHACGHRAAEIVAASGISSTAARATGVEAYAQEDIMVARTRALQGDGTPCSILNLHHDRHNGKDGRKATFMLNLATIDPALHGGETYFPAANAPADDPFVAELDRLYAGGQRFLPRTSAAGLECEERLECWRRDAALREAHQHTGQPHCDGGPPLAPSGSAGAGVGACAGVALLFDTSKSAGAWHAPCLVRTGPRGERPPDKVTLTWFKAAPPLWSAALLHSM